MNDSQTARLDTPEHEVRSAVSALYSACHLSAPRVVFASSVEDYTYVCKGFRAGAFLEFEFVNVVIIAILATLIIATIVAMEQIIINVTFSGPGGQILAYGWSLGWPMIMFNVVVYLSIVSSLFYWLSLDTWKLLGLRRRGMGMGGKSMATPLDRGLIRRGALPTPEAMVGALASAMAATGRAMPPESLPARWGVDRWQDRCLRVGAVMKDVEPQRFMMANLAMLRDFIGEQAGLSAGLREHMPIVLQHACAVDSMVDEVLLLDGLAVVLPKAMFVASSSGTPAGAAQPHELVGGYDLRSLEPWQAAQCRQALGRHGDNVAAMLRVAVGWRNPAEADIVYRAVGMDRTVDLLALKSLSSDSSGELYRIGQGSSVVCVVRVQDRVVSVDGQPLVHWLSVPQHVSTAREGVAWSYGLSQKSYQPTVEA